MNKKYSFPILLTALFLITTFQNCADVKLISSDVIIDSTEPTPTAVPEDTITYKYGVFGYSKNGVLLEVGVEVMNFDTGTIQVLSLGTQETSNQPYVIEISRNANTRRYAVLQSYHVYNPTGLSQSALHLVDMNLATGNLSLVQSLPVNYFIEPGSLMPTKDCNGDGVKDFIVGKMASYNYTGNAVECRSGTNLALLQSWSFPGSVYAIVPDRDGDGVREILMRDGLSNTYKVIGSQAMSFTSPLSSFQGTGNTYYMPIVPIAFDFNSDGTFDYITPHVRSLMPGNFGLDIRSSANASILYTLRPPAERDFYSYATNIKNFTGAGRQFLVTSWLVNTNPSSGNNPRFEFYSTSGQLSKVIDETTLAQAIAEADLPVEFDRTFPVSNYFASPTIMPDVDGDGSSELLLGWASDYIVYSVQKHKVLKYILNPNHYDFYPYTNKQMPEEVFVAR